MKIIFKNLTFQKNNSRIYETAQKREKVTAINYKSKSGKSILTVLIHPR